MLDVALIGAPSDHIRIRILLYMISGISLVLRLGGRM